MKEMFRSTPERQTQEKGHVHKKTRDDLIGFGKEVTDEQRKKIYEDFDQFKKTEKEPEKELAFKSLSRRIRNHIESNNLDRIDAGMQMAYQLFTYVRHEEAYETFRNPSERLFRDSEQRLYERFRRNPELLRRYLKQVKHNLQDVDDFNEDKAAPEEWISEVKAIVSSQYGRRFDREFKVIEEGGVPHLEVQVDDESFGISYGFQDGMEVFIQIYSIHQPYLNRYITQNNFEAMPMRGNLEEFIRKIREEKESEDQNRHILQTYDLPRGKEKTMYQMFIPEIYDPIVASTLTSQIGLRAVLESQLDITVPPFQLLGRDAQEELVAFVQRAKAEGYETVQLDLSQHGQGTGFDNFGTVELQEVELGQTWLPPGYKTKVIVDHSVDSYHLIKALGEISISSDIDINLSTVACYGAGLISAYELIGENYAHLNIFTQTKPDIVNRTIKLNREDQDFSDRNEKISSTYYLLYLIEGLDQGMTYGQAVDYADQKSQEVTRLNPESVIHGTVIR